MPNLIRVLGVGVVASCVAMLALPSSAAPGFVNAGFAPAAKASAAAGPSKLAELLARYDAMKPGRDRDALALEIDRFAGQRYATVSRLFWYTSLDDAKAAAAARHQPILHLRMLGRLDEDLSCANSRFFRTTLYANTETSKFLRENFVLYWSSERPVPRVTIDFGDGRKLERTTTGNSAHYVMDDRGNVLDVLPGLYAPLVFRTELAKSLELAKSVRKLEGNALVDAVVAFHEAELRRSQTQFASVAGTAYVSGRGRLIGAGEIGAAALERAQQATYAKAAIEVVDLRRIGLAAGVIDPADIAQWATIGQKVWNIGFGPPPSAPQRLPRQRDAVPAPMLLDAASIGLVEKLRAGNPLPMKSDALLARLEQAILADTALNEFRLRQQIRYELVASRNLSFVALNEVIYASVFHTPKSDAWLGLLDNTDFTGLPADGVVMP